MLITNGSQQDYDGMGGKDTGKPAWTSEEFSAMVAFMTRFNESLEKSGELVETRGLAGPVHTRRVSGLKDGVPVVTDGPYAETQEVLAGYWIVECDGIDRATEIAAELSRCPGPAHIAESAYIDVRPLQEAAGDML
ncbi:MAG TPA: YciI family protein [Phytomonospora sp.]